MDMTQATAVKVSEDAQRVLKGAGLLALPWEFNSKAPQIDLAPHWIDLRTRWAGKAKRDVILDPITMDVHALLARLSVDTHRNPNAAANLILRFLIRTDHEPACIHPLVDAINIASARSHLPMAVFDARAIKGELELDMSNWGESLTPIGSDVPLQIPQRSIVLRDQERILSWFMVRDDQAQRVQKDTHQALLLACYVPATGPQGARDALAHAASLLSAKE